MVFLFILLIFFILIIFSKIQIEIINLKYTSKKVKLSHLNDKYKIQIKILILSIIPILKISITKERLQKLKLSEKINNIDIDLSKIGKDINLNFIKQLKNIINLQIKQFKLKVYIGTENTVLTSILIPAISTIISIILSRKKVRVENQTFGIEPIYNCGNLLNMELEGIFELKLIHIIKVIYIINRKRRVEKNERTSNRRAYGYSYE